jgi:ABC-type multidrug transport system ATPase subunit
MEPMIEAKGLTRAFGDVLAIDRLDLSVQKGEAYGFLGLNGAGKTTTVRILTGTLAPTMGLARVRGVNVAHLPHEVRSHIGVMFGDNLVGEPTWSVVRYLRHFGAIYGMNREHADERAHEILSRLRLDDFAERPVGKLSGGNKRKVELARALLHEPDVVFLDEPTRELDIPSRYATWGFLRELAATGVTLFVSTHDVLEVESLCSRIGVIREGHLVWEGRPRDLVKAKGSLIDALVRLLEGVDGPPVIAA